MFEKPEVPQFVIISFVFFLLLSPSLHHGAHTSPSVAYCLTSEQLIFVFSSVAACLTPVMLEIRRRTRENETLLIASYCSHSTDFTRVCKGQ